MPFPNRYQLKHAKIDTATLGNNTIVAAVTGKTIVVVSYLVFNSHDTVDTDVKWIQGSTDLTGILRLAASGGVSYAGSLEAPAFETAKGAALILNLSAAQQTSGHVTYFEF